MNKIPFRDAVTLGQVALCYHRDRKTFRKMIGPLLNGKLSHLKDGRIRKIFPCDLKLIAEFLGDTEYRVLFPKITLVSIAKAYGWSVAQLTRNIAPIEKELKNTGFIPGKALTPRHAQMIFNHLGIPEDETLLKYFKFY